MQDVCSTEVPHRLDTGFPGLLHHLITRQGLRSKVGDLQSCAFSGDAFVGLTQDDVVGSDHITKVLRKVAKERISPTSPCRLRPLLPRSTFQTEDVEREVRAEMLNG